MNVQELKDKYDIEMWNDEKIMSFQKTLLEWYDKEKRDLPWRRTTDPYKIWVSEIMLQQTRVDTVIPYYEHFLEELPTIKDLAEASEDKILKLWEGLGYYSRVKNMQTAAQQIMLHYNGKFPNQYENILKLKGIGPYTAGAISSIAFSHPEPAVDGNLMRVFARLFEIDLDVKKQSNRKVFEAVGRHIIDHDRPGDFNQALMDLGATISTPKNYDPSISPVRNFNQSYINDTWKEYPVASKKKKAKPVTYLAVLIQDNAGNFLLEKRPKDGLLANMWTFPLIEEKEMENELEWKSIQQKTFENLSNDEATQLDTIIEEKYKLSTDMNPQTTGVVTHAFSHLKWTIYMYEAEVNDETGNIPDQCEWVSPSNFDKYVFPKPQQKMWEEFQTQTLF